MNSPRYCPDCNFDTQGQPIPEKHLEWYSPADTHYSMWVGQYDCQQDSTVAYICPQCRHRLERK